MNSPALDVSRAMRPELSGTAVVRLAFAYAAATNGMILTPFLVAAVMLRFHLEEGTATQIAGIEILGIALSCALFPRWISRTARSFTTVAVLGVIAGQVSSALAPSVLLMSAARGFTGLFEGVLFVVVASSISQRASSDSLWGQINLIAGGINGGILVAISYLPEVWLGRWLFLLLAILVIVMSPLVGSIGNFAAVVGSPTAGSGSRLPKKVPLKLVVTIWIVTVLIYGVQSSQWAVVGIVGAHAGLPSSTVGILLSVSSLLGFAGAVIPSQRASHPHRLKIIWTAQLTMIGSIVWFFGSTDTWSYFLSQLFLNAAFFVVIPFLTGLLSEVDPDGSLVARTVVITFIGAGLGTAVAGSLFDRYGASHFAYVLCICIAAASPFVWFALRGATAHITKGATQQLPS
ncbi:Predicted arabinose efflux permease, MFS family [Paraburkholderia steynii]|uniref:Predicted arabinose efflux permease, MFS family n=1 Tax=Paraburkholderia steynii TaxID=1245441 RepID=A0A7Z7BM31_9BURK|nr:MFS transporter [Paraburkholderia steynii]SDJ56603.1 Predicted arabinose efflux permease, MFS family [Paraburkholderia steynii]